MNKALILLGALALLLGSCSNNDSDSDTRNEIVLLKKKIETDSEGQVTTFDYKYDGQKLISSTATSGDEVIYTYTGNFITKIEFKFDNIEIQENSFTYTSDGKLSSFTRVELLENYGYKEMYTYNNTNETITVQSYEGDASEQTSLGDTSTITFSNGEINEIANANLSNHKYVYDLKNNPFKNVLGLDKIAFVDGEASGGILHNLTSDASGNVGLSKYIYTYNNDDYPSKSVKTEVGETATVEFFY